MFLSRHRQNYECNDEAPRNDTRGDGGREGEVVLDVGGSAVATEGELCHLHPLGDSARRSLADNGARVPKALPTAGLEGVVVGLIIAVLPEPFGGAAVGKDVEEPTAAKGCLRRVTDR